MLINLFMDYVKKITLILALFFGVICCTTEEVKKVPDHLGDLEQLIIIQPNSEPEYEIDFIHSAEIEHSSATNNWFVDWSDEFWAFSGGDFWFAGLEIDDSGRIYVGNSREKTIQVFDSDGSFLTETGGEGRGPGEFSGITEIKIKNNQLFAFDFLQFRTTFYSLDPLNVAEVKNAYLSRDPNIAELTGWLSNGFKLIDDERFLVRYVDEFPNANIDTPNYNLDKTRLGRYYIVNREGEVESELLFELKNLKNITADIEGRHIWNIGPVPFLNQPLVSISDDGHIISANSDESLIKMVDSNGDYLRSFYIPMEKKSLIRDEILNMYDDAGEATLHLLQNAELPETWPALADILMDDENRLWIATIPESEELVYEWWLIQDTGALLATFRWPGNRSIEKINNGYLYTRETEESTGIQTIVKYRIEMDQ
ncbi:MAG: 6-bladed beta-propeller [Balneolaceae bacterium]|nr:6-bladed beta-propeller [Balneolaceae bacterium]